MPDQPPFNQANDLDAEVRFLMEMQGLIIQNMGSRDREAFFAAVKQLEMLRKALNQAGFKEKKDNVVPTNEQEKARIQEEIRLKESQLCELWKKTVEILRKEGSIPSGLIEAARQAPDSLFLEALHRHQKEMEEAEIAQEEEKKKIGYQKAQDQKKGDKKGH